MLYAGGYNISCFGTNNGAIDIFDNDIEQPEWFQEHYQQEHGKKGQGMGKGKNKNE